MHIVLTDILTCPRCGPAFGLILRADVIEARRALEGVLGCANCREQYPLAGGAANFGADPVPPPRAGGEDDGRVLRLGALLGVTEGPAFVVLAGPVADCAAGLAELVPALEVVAVSGGAGAAAYMNRSAPRRGVNVLGVPGRSLPLASGKVAGAALSGSATDELLEEGARIISPVGRLVLEDAPADAEERLQRAGLRVVAREGDTLVAVRA